MANDKDYREVLSGTVEEVKGKIRNLDSPDYKELLRLEKEGEDRKTLKNFLNRKIDALRNNDEDASEEEQTEETEDAGTEEADGFEHSDNQSFMDKLGELSVGKLLLVGGVGGLIIGLLLGYGLGPTAVQGQPDDAEQAMQELFSGSDVDADIGEPVSRHGMYFFNVTMTQEAANGTQTGHRTYYVTEDAELLFPVIQNPLIGNIPVEIDQALAQQRQAQQQQNGTQ